MSELLLMSKLHVVGGCPGAWDDDLVLEKLARIEKECPIEFRYQSLDWLFFGVTNNHPHGWAAAVLETVARAMDKY
jgi:hypothetical protein